MTILGRPPINKHPLGILDFFGIKNGGQYPQSLGQDLQPVIDLLRHYTEMAAQVYTWQGTQAVSQSASSTEITLTNPVDLTSGGQLIIPSTEVWFITAAHIQWTMNANDQAWFNIADTDPVGAVPGYSRYWPMNVQGHNTTSAIAQTRRGVSVLQTPVYVLPGRLIVVPHNGINIGTGPVNWFGSMSIVRMRL